jgi:hypothetical protein
MFFSRQAVFLSQGRKRMTYKMVTDMLKACAERVDLPREKFSTKSLKTGGISSLKALGVDQAGLLSRMDHRTASASRHYQRPELGQTQGPLAGGEGGFSTLSVRTDLAMKSGVVRPSAT